jgi:succinate dehydrogenase/fumarate reductase flavoprotein subunit
MKVDKDAIGLFASQQPPPDASVVGCCDFHILGGDAVLRGMSVAFGVVFGRVANIGHVGHVQQFVLEVVDREEEEACDAESYEKSLIAEYLHDGDGDG